MNEGAATVRIARDEPGLADALASVLVDCVEGGASVSFMSPLPREKAHAFWAEVIAASGRGERLLLIAELPGRGVVGTVQLVLNLPENQPHRADVAKLLVRSDARRSGVAHALMLAAEAAAVAQGRRLLVLDTVTGGDAERLYASLGWCRVGEIPDFALWPDGRPCSTTVFYKRLG